MLKSFWIAGFEGSCHRRRDAKRLDLLESTQHDRFVVEDYARLAEVGMRTARDGVRWHRIEVAPGRYDFSSLLPMVRAARDARIQVLWNLCHYGYPDGLDPFRPEFVDRFARFAGAVARVIAEETDEVPVYTPVNEISFWSWAGGDVGYFNPCETGRGFELKAQLVRATLAAVDAIWQVDRRARILHTDPAIHIMADPARPEDARLAEEKRLAQFQAWDMIQGRIWPQLRGDRRYLDLLGVNFYPHNQWVHEGPKLRRGEPGYRPLREILREIHHRFHRPLLIAETGTHDDERRDWLRYVGREVRAAQRSGVPVHGICLYPVLDYPGWDDDRYCACGLWGYADARGHREICRPLAAEIARQTDIFRRDRAVPPVFDQHPAASDELSAAPGVEEEIEHAAR
ncbi:MAG TPA: beta-glucosidase [Thermoanaerobaculia bacterium]|nr:beta-glucosidase [Thermoanaerobaculia bacterium]